jgi:hypothetical protein
MNAIAHPAPTHHHHWTAIGIAAAAASAGITAIFVVGAVTGPEPVSPSFTPAQIADTGGVTSACFRPPFNWPEADVGGMPACVHP